MTDGISRLTADPYELQGEVFMPPQAPDALDVAYTANFRKNGVWKWTRQRNAFGAEYWKCDHVSGGTRIWAELLHFHGPAFAKVEDLLYAISTYEPPEK